MKCIILHENEVERETPQQEFSCSYQTLPKIYALHVAKLNTENIKLNILILIDEVKSQPLKTIARDQKSWKTIKLNFAVS